MLILTLMRMLCVGSAAGCWGKWCNIYRCGRCFQAETRDRRRRHSRSVPDSRCPCTQRCSVQYWSVTGFCRRTSRSFPPNGKDLRPPTHKHRLAHKSSIRMPLDRPAPICSNLRRQITSQSRRMLQIIIERCLYNRHRGRHTKIFGWAKSLPPHLPFLPLYVFFPLSRFPSTP